jgi:biopolymer transport protein ExbB/TolQ
VKKIHSNTSHAFLPTLVLPVFLGLFFFCGLLWFINNQTMENELLSRYVVGHPVSLVTTAMFCVGMAALILIGKNVFDQYWARRKMTLASVSLMATGDDQVESTTARAQRLMDHLILMPRRFREFYLWNRLFEILQIICRTGTTANLDDELKYAAETDLDRQPEKFALVRILIWATPMLGFLGTVLGISQALGSIEVGADNDFQQMLGGLRSSLYVAFDTTALALTFSIVLMFVQFVVDRWDTQLLELIEGRCRAELDRHFEIIRHSNDPSVRAIECIGDQINNTLENSTYSQVEIWAEAMEQAERRWQDSVTESATIARENLVQALEAAAEKLRQSVDANVDRADQQMDRRWQQMQVTMSDNARIIHDQQKELTYQTELMSGGFSQFESLIDSLKTAQEVDRKHIEQFSLIVAKLGQALAETKNQEPAKNKELKFRIVRPSDRAA